MTATSKSRRRYGQAHPRAKITDHEVELMRRLAERGMPQRVLADKFELSIWAVGRICRFERRNCSAGLT